jgi:hypothetical protein
MVNVCFARVLASFGRGRAVGLGWVQEGGVCRWWVVLLDSSFDSVRLSEWFDLIELVG